MRLSSRCASLGVVICLVLVKVHADLTWNWNYSGSGIAAAGTLTTTDASDASGFYQVLSISGLRNEVEITGLYPTGQAIPGNEPFTVDNLLKQGPDGQITAHGLGYTLASGAYSNPFFADFDTPPGYLEVFTHGSVYSELPVQFYATPVPEADSAALAITGFTIMVLGQNLRRWRTSEQFKQAAQSGSRKRRWENWGCGGTRTGTRTSSIAPRADQSDSTSSSSSPLG